MHGYTVQLGSQGAASTYGDACHEWVLQQLFFIDGYDTAKRLSCGLVQGDVGMF